MTNQKGFVKILIILAVLAIAAGVGYMVLKKTVPAEKNSENGAPANTEKNGLDVKVPNGGGDSNVAGGAKLSYKVVLADWEKDFEYNVSHSPSWTAKPFLYLTPAQEAQGESPKPIGAIFEPTTKLMEYDYVQLGGHQESCEQRKNFADGYKPEPLPLRCVYASKGQNVISAIFTLSKNNEVLKFFDLLVERMKKDGWEIRVYY